MKFTTINPATELPLRTYSYMDTKMLNAAISNSHNAFKEYKHTSFHTRQKLMLKVAEILELKKLDFATLITKEMGKPISFAIAEIEKCTLVVNHYAKHAEEYLKNQSIKTDLAEYFVTYQPLGVIFAIMPWNFPFWQVFRFAAPNLMAGNVIILKHAPNCFGSGEEISQIFKEAGFMQNVFQHIIIDAVDAAEVIENPMVAGVTLTGSERAGRSVASTAGKNLTKSVLELGGNDPYIVFADADLDLAAEEIVKSRLNNSGQVCIAAKRIIVIQEVADELIKKILSLVKNYVIGDPLNSKTQCGPLARNDLRAEVHSQVKESIRMGAKLVLGGKIPKDVGFYYPVTVLTDVLPGMPAFDDEIFGPVFAFISVLDEESAINYANKSRFGLSSAIFSKNIEKAKKIAVQELEAGSCFINSMAASNPLLPFGGIKNSGFGRELGREGLIEFMNVKTIGIKKHE
jgi:succinate-semialdehyde dehydrogenase/glutarate-semialdehyde dehydrogenase